MQIMFREFRTTKSETLAPESWGTPAKVATKVSPTTCATKLVDTRASAAQSAPPMSCQDLSAASKAERFSKTVAGRANWMAIGQKMQTRITTSTRNKEAIEPSPAPAALETTSASATTKVAGKKATAFRSKPKRNSAQRHLDPSLRQARSFGSSPTQVSAVAWITAPAPNRQGHSEMKVTAGMSLPTSSSTTNHTPHRNEKEERKRGEPDGHKDLGLVCARAEGPPNSLVRPDVSKEIFVFLHRSTKSFDFDEVRSTNFCKWGSRRRTVWWSVADDVICVCEIQC
jgi:hypothetical protein